MDEVDIENAEDLNELEARLYAQIHHEPSGDVTEPYKEASPVRQVTTNSVINNRSINRNRVGRYWNEKVTAPSVSKSISTSEIQVTQADTEKSTQDGGGDQIEKPAETVDKSFQPPVKNLSNLRVNPFASGNGPKTKGSSTLPRVKYVNTEKAKKIDAKTNKGPFARQITKLAHAVKYDGKKQKAKTARAKVKKVPLGGLINLLSSDESEKDEVIEVPLPTPSIVTIDTSSDEENPTAAKEEESSFVKPEALLGKENSSRCTSPCSVVSDDFIAQNDRSRLLEEDERPDDEDLLTLQMDVDSLMEAPESSTSKAPETNATPTRRASEKSTTNYRVTQNDFRALDVYESESDIQESVYSKGSKSTKPSLVVNLENESSSSDDIQEVEITQKAKRLTKRRPSSINKEDAYIDDSTDSEEENESESFLNKSRDGVYITKVPFISHGVALEKVVTDNLQAKNTSVNNSDNEFIATLNTLAQGSPSVASQSRNQSDDEDNSITARAIAESVLRGDTTDDNTTCTATVEPVIVHDEEANDALPNESLIDLDTIFTEIDNMDNMNKKVKEQSHSENSEASVELVTPVTVPRVNKPARGNSKRLLQNTPGDPVYNIVYWEDSKQSGGIGWNDEMRKFYNDSWKGERFNVNSLRRQMQTQKSLWKIYTDDRFPKYRKFSHQKCMNCCEFGHLRSKCPKPRKVAVCYMCGEKGHHEPRCPNTICLRCGNKTRMFTKSCNSCNYQNRLLCPICKVRGHSLNLCPDKWRRYHSTTKPNEYPNNKVEYKNRKLCCICGMRGHLAENCRIAYNFAEYPIFVSDIRSHQKSYDDIAIKTIRSGIGYNLMYKPEEDVSFELAENQSPHHYYGRFLMAVGMGYLLSRKRRASATVEDQPADKQKKKPENTTLKEYVVNPFAKVALDKPPAQAKSAVLNIEVDGPTEKSSTENANPTESTIEEEVEIDPQPSTSKQAIQEVEKLMSESNRATQNKNEKASPSVSAFKTPDPALPGSSSKKDHEVMEVVDSDSNYSFSEHFEPAATPQHKGNPGNAREMGPLPDFIPIVDDDDDDTEQSDELLNAGISKRFVSVDTDDEEDKNREMPDIPCEAKVYLTNFHSKFLLSPNGNKFLVEKSKTFNIKARLDWTSVGHILIIHGLRLNQDKFHTELLLKFRELSETLNRNQLEKSQKVPRKTEVLIRFLRENLSQLLVNLGNPNDLVKRLAFQENQQTKTGWKSAEKTRRLLNMILIGQAGLCNGSMHLDNLLSQLRVLIDEHTGETVPNETRLEIESHWKFIFSSHRHEKYKELVEAYNNLSIKNRFQNINIDPRLLGKKMLDTNLTKAQKDKMDKPSDTNPTKTPTVVEKTSTPVKLVPNPAATTKSQIKQPKTPLSDRKRPKNIVKNSPSVSQTESNKQKPVPTGSQTPTESPVATTIRAANAKWEAKCTNLLSEINKTDKQKKGGAPIRDNKASSMFWSREAIKYIDECMELGKSNASFVAKLSRVQMKSQKGLLSYNDYRAIINIHNAIKSKH